MALFSAVNMDDAAAQGVSLDSAPQAGGRLLVVDDEESVALTVSEVLRQEGFRVETASSGTEAVKLLEATEYDLVLTDLHMEGGDGISVLSEIQQRSPLTISIVLTGFASVETAIAAMRSGAYDYLVKPCNIEDLKHTVKRGVEHRLLMLREREARARLEEFNRELQKRVEERTIELVRRNEELAEANRAKDIFLATLSHELRTPLTPVLGWVNLLKTGALDKSSTMQALDTIERNARLQARLVDDLLDISRIVTGKLQFEREPVDLNAIVRAAVDTMRGQATQREVALTSALPPAPLVVQGSPVRLEQIVLNLISNAVKFTEAGGQVTVRVEQSDSRASVVVEDTGVGIAPEFLPHVFESFRQADGSTTRQHGGLGLGLAIVRALARMHEGGVRAESDGIGKGARFIFTLPCEVEACGQPEVRAYESPCAALMSVLVVEDSPDTLMLLNVLFEKRGCRVLAAESAAEALEIAERETPDIVISDIGMPEMSGYELLRSLRRLPGMEHVPALAITGYATEEDRQHAIKAGFTAHLAKPIDPDELFDLVQKLTSGNS
ncbi:MAG TPA: response regulator [Pyrinomonadaceae bacterium]|nr:response regulator [Pyrinomonadaceae bacterium]